MDNKIYAFSSALTISDQEVIEKASHGKNGERFAALYEGNWFSGNSSGSARDSVDINWSHSEADIALCGILAFYCRGDLSQIDRLFRASGLYRDKWDREQNGSTYGVITMTNAIANCQSFYDPKSEWEQRVAGYKSIIDNLVKEATASKAGISIESLLTEEALTAAAWAMRYDTVYYVKLREIVPQKLGLRLYEKNVKAHLSSLPHAANAGSGFSNDSLLETLEPLVLTGIDCSGLRVPHNWHVTDNGITHVRLDGAEEYVAADFG